MLNSTTSVIDADCKDGNIYQRSCGRWHGVSFDQNDLIPMLHIRQHLRAQ